MEQYRKKLIEVALPLEAINRESAREKSIRHGHPSTLHLWWARRPLAACRAVLFAQLVDDPSAHPDKFPTEAAQEAERKRLFKIIEELVKWGNSNDPLVLGAAKAEIARSVAWGRGETPPEGEAAINAYLTEKAPPVLDPFCGGGSIPLEAQRLGLRAYASDLNPVAVLITKALIEIPPKFAGRRPVNPEAQKEFAKGAPWLGKGAQGLAEDVRYYGQWMRDEAEKRIGHLYPKVKLPKAMGGGEATVIAWLWARTVASPNPVCRGAHVPLASSFALSTKQGKEAIVVPVVDTKSGTYRFTIKDRGVTAAELARTKKGTKSARGAHFTCLITDTPITPDYIKAEGKAGRMGVRLMAIVAEGTRGRVYLSPDDQHVRSAENAASHEAVAAARETFLSGSTPERLTGGTCYGYGLTTWGKLFTPRQLVALTTFSDLVGEAHERVLTDARAAGLPDDGKPLNDGGTGAAAYADAMATYLAFGVSKALTRNCSLTLWEPGMGRLAGAFGRQAIPMQWSFAETNPLAGAGGDIAGTAGSLSEVLDAWEKGSAPTIFQHNATSPTNVVSVGLVSTDPPYYDNVGYADLSDFFYVWLRRSLRSVYPDLFGTLLVSKADELVATPYRHRDKESAERFFTDGMSGALRSIEGAATPLFPIAVYYAFKQAEGREEGVISTGWATFLEAAIASGLSVNGTWPIRTEATNALKKDVNALASSIVLVCRKRSTDAAITTRAEFVKVLKRELPDGLRLLQHGSIAPVDLAQAAIGPGMAIFSRYGKVLEANGNPMHIRTSLQLINQILDEFLAAQEGDLDQDTRFCVAWYEQYGFKERAFGEAEVLTKAKNTSVQGLVEAGVLAAKKGKVQLLPRNDLPADWDPATDRRVTDWECTQHLVRVLTIAGGNAEAARLIQAMGPVRAENARALAYRLYTIADRKGWADEALAYNILVTSGPGVQEALSRLQVGGPAQAELPV